MEGEPGDFLMADIIAGAKQRGKTEVVTLLKRFKVNPAETRHQMRVEIGWFDEAAAEMFALVVFVSDGLLQVTRGNHPTSTPPARFFSMARGFPWLSLNHNSENPIPKQPDFESPRFFRIAIQLPLELQMVLCHRLMGSTKEIISGKDSEAAFKCLAMRI